MRYQRLPIDAVLVLTHRGVHTNTVVQWWAGDFHFVEGVSVPRRFYLTHDFSVLVVDVKPFSVSKFPFYNQPLEGWRISEELGIITPGVRRAWTVGRMLKYSQEHRQRILEYKEWIEATGMSEPEFSSAVKILVAIGAVVQKGDRFAVWGKPVSPLELISLE